MLKIGADPEFFLKKDGEFHSAVNLIPGTKKEPFPVKSGAIQVDGMALEFNITPSNRKRTFVKHINEVLFQLREMIPYDYSFSIEASAHFSEAHMNEQPKEALDLGCDPDFNAYNNKQNPTPKPFKGLRTAAGHIHIGWIEDADPNDPTHILDCIAFVKQLDVILGLPSLIEDKDTLRRNVYGKAGAFRPKKYGVEYRVLSNYWLKNNNLMGAIFDRVLIAEANLKAGNVWSEEFPNVETIINEGQIKNAVDICNHLGIYIIPPGAQ